MPEERLPLRGAGAKRLRGVTAPKAYRRGSACAQGRWRAAAPGGGTPLRHAARATSPQGEAFRVQLMSRFTSFSKEGNSMKYIFITGGVVSGLGKGICAASWGGFLKQRGLRVRNQKFDPYLNVDPGTMSPYQHARSSSPTTALRPTWILATTNALWTSVSPALPRCPRARSTGASSPGSGRAATWRHRADHSPHHR